MSDAISQTHPAVVLRSQYVHLRTLLVIAIVAVVALAAAVVVLATDSDEAAVKTAAPVTAPATAPATDTLSKGTTRFDGGPEEGTRGIVPDVAPATAYNGPH